MENNHIDIVNGRIIDQILPQKKEKYIIDEIDKLIESHQDVIELEQRKNNDQFDTALGPEIDHLRGLHNQISKLQLAILKTQCDITYAKEQYYVVESIGENPVIKERYEILKEQRELQQSLQQLKFKPIVDFFHLYARHLESSIEDGRRLCSIQAASNIHQLFDWTHYHHIVLVLRACGKALIDVDKFERLYLASANIVSMTFKQPIESIQFNNFIEFYDTFSLETQLMITNRHGENETIDQLLYCLNIPNSKALEHQLLSTVLVCLKKATEDCCRLLIDINMSYIEAHLTDGINIDKLNGTDNNGSFSSQEDNSLPLYALSPQDYITQIGQHLLTLRKHTEQFDISKNEPLKLGLEYMQQAQDIPTNKRSYGTVTEIVMSCIARHCIRSLLGRTSNSILSKLTVRGKRQLATDALYLDNVLEDLGLLSSDEPNISRFKSLLSQ